MIPIWAISDAEIARGDAIFTVVALIIITYALAQIFFARTIRTKNPLRRLMGLQNRPVTEASIYALRVMGVIWLVVGLFLLWFVSL